MKKILVFLLILALMTPVFACAEEQTPAFKNLGDPSLLGYTEDMVYAQLEAELGSDDYIVEDVSAVYISQEYLEELAYNSKANIYFGYTLAELDAQFEGTRYVFTLGEDNGTTVEEFEYLQNDTTSRILKNVAIGTGVILICVTVSVLTAGTGAITISSMFAVAAEKGAEFALMGAGMGAISAGVVKGIETGNVKEALKAAAIGGSEGFKWGAVTGAVSGGIGEWMRLHPAEITWRDSEEAALKFYKNSTPQVAYKDRVEVLVNTQNSTRPDIVRMINNHLDAIEVKNYNLSNNNCLNELTNVLKREISDRIVNLPAKSTQRIMLDVRNRDFSTDIIDNAKKLIWNSLDDIYPNIPIDVMF